MTEDSIWLCGDVHGNLRTLQRALQQAPEKPLAAVLLGDLAETGKLELLRSVEMTETSSGGEKTTSSFNGWSSIISDEAARRFRNPPAHTTFASFDVAEDCIDYVTDTLEKVLGYEHPDGAREGWVRDEVHSES